MTKHYPSPFKKGDQFTFENKHGRAVLEAISESVPIKKIRLEDVPKEHLITWDEVEQIALITDQVRLQPLVSPNLETKSCSYIRHDTPSSAGYCKVVELDYKCSQPAHERIAQDLAEGRNRLP